MTQTVVKIPSISLSLPEGKPGTWDYLIESLVLITF
jgi:hypothetical protein